MTLTWFHYHSDTSVRAARKYHLIVQQHWPNGREWEAISSQFTAAKYMYSGKVSNTLRGNRKVLKCQGALCCRRTWRVLVGKTTQDAHTNDINTTETQNKLFHLPSYSTFDLVNQIIPVNTRIPSLWFGTTHIIPVNVRTSQHFIFNHPNHSCQYKKYSANVRIPSGIESDFPCHQIYEVYRIKLLMFGHWRQRHAQNDFRYTIHHCYFPN